MVPFLLFYAELSNNLVESVFQHLFLLSMLHNYWSLQIKFPLNNTSKLKRFCYEEILQLRCSNANNMFDLIHSGINSYIHATDKSVENLKYNQTAL